MKANLFRPVAFWKSVMMTVPETAFFELVRSVFGKIKTPFNKQGLVNDLESFLSRDDVQKAAAAYIERQDAMVIAAVAALGEPAPGELESFFSGEMSYAELSGIIVNLEERFILYRLRDEARPGGAGHLALNPVLQKVLAPAAENLSLLFPSLPAEAAGGGGAQKAALVDDRLFAALLSFASRGEVFLKNEGEIRKKFIENGSVLFPGIDLQAFLGAFAAIGLLYVEDGKLLPSYARFSDFAALGRRGRLMWCAAGMAFYGQSQVPFGLLEHLAKMGVQNNVALAGRLLDSLEPERLYPEKTLKRLMDILLRDQGADAGKGDKERLLDALEKTGLLLSCPHEGGGGGRLFRLGFAEGAGAVAEKNPTVVADSDFSFTLYPEISYEDAVALAQALDIRSAGTVTRFEMTRESASRAFDRNIPAADITRLLQRLSAGRISDVFVWTVNEWEKRYGEVSLRTGLVLSLCEERRYLAGTKALAGLIRETLAPGLYLLHESAQGEAAAALAAAGVDMVCTKRPSADRVPDGAPYGVPDGSSWEKGARNYFSLPAASGDATVIAGGGGAGGGFSADGFSADLSRGLLDGFRAMLDAAPFSKSEKEELAARIDRRLILCESQLRNADLRYEKLEARLLDYPGKVNVAKQAIAQQSLVEVLWGDGAAGGAAGGAGGVGTGTRVFGIPKSLVKEDGGQFLLVAPSGTGGGEVRIPLGKIILLRRVKKSIFET